MLLSPADVPAGSVLRSDVCIVGAGAAGITLARELRGSALRVLLIESGGFEPDEQTQALADGRSVGKSYFALRSSRLRYFGGTTNHWQGFSRPLDPVDFEPRKGMERSGWPISRSDLDPFYEQAHDLLQLGPYEYSPQRLGEAIKASPFPFDPKRASTIVIRFSSPPTHFGQAYREDILAADNVQLVLHSTVVELDADEAARNVRRIRAKRFDASEFQVEASAFVLAAGGLENPRLLLASNRVKPEGLGNDYDLVGRFFMEHQHVDGGVLTIAPGRHSPQLYEMNWLDSHPFRGAIALSAAFLRSQGALNFTATLLDLDAAESKRLVEEIGARPLEDLLRRSGQITEHLRFFELGVMGEQEPNPASRVTLSQDRDALGMRKIRLDWQLTDKDHENLRLALGALAGEFGRLGIGRLMSAMERGPEKSAPKVNGGHHHMGTTRMSADPRTGVVDSDCKVHGMGNLYVAGSSVFSTSGSANPTLTLVALALRLSRHLKETLRP